MIKNKKNNAGSTLIMVLMAMSVLSILGICIIGVSLANYRMRIADRKIKQSFYYADAKYEEIYSVIEENIEEAIALANEYVKVNVQSEIDTQRVIESLDVTLDQSQMINGTDGHGSVNDAVLKEHMNENFFKAKYKEYMNNNLISEIENSIRDIDGDLATDDTEVVGIDITSVENYKNSNDDPLAVAIKFKSTKNDMQKEIEGSFNIKVPNYEKPLQIKNDMVVLKENVLWTKAITTDKNIIVNNDDVTINGDVYCYGSSSDIGGLRVGSSKRASLNIRGNVFTNKNVLVNYNNSELTIDNGDVYCESLIIPDNIEEALISINNGALNTFDDIELNGKKSKIEISGAYFGFSDGSERTKSHDESSAIIINSPDIEVNNGSKLKITGDNNDSNVRQVSLFNDSNEKKSGIYIGGTVYVELDKPYSELNNHNYYQTGESIALRGNYKAYQEVLKPDGSGTRDAKFKPENIMLGSYEPLVLVKKLNGTFPNADDKSKYFMYYNTDYGDLSTGTSSSIDISNVKFSLGSYINGDTINGFVGAIPEFESVKLIKNRDYKYAINNMLDLGLYDDTMHDISISSSLENQLDDVVSIDDRVLFTHDIFDFDSIKDTLLICNDSKDVYIYSGTQPSEYNSSRDLAVNTNRVARGIVVTKGDIIISGDVEYDGVLVAGGNVVFQGNGTQIVTNNFYSSFTWQRSFIDNLAKNKNMVKAFNHSENNGKTIHFAKGLSVGNNDIKSYRKYRDLIEDRWTRSR